MNDKNKILDIQDRIKNKQLLEQSQNFIVCPNCENPEFAVITGLNPNREIFIKHLVCCSAECDGNTYFDVAGGVVDPEAQENV